ncbi:hypothetical protein QN277_023506 [Acacia crassicarpa]|uniref:Uncharacterized protein n=1 Tax=Acacia crassicarpa TaxID=499986 RepID=A0AAE1MJV6_9FABA|nr:hypothetical protein QN277_023506 [Acacia crassicarpa]
MATRSFSRYFEEELGKIPHFMIFSMLEWLLIIILFIDGLISFAANEFARFFELRILCLLCTRLDHALVHRNPDFYYNDSFESLRSSQTKAIYMSCYTQTCYFVRWVRFSSHPEAVQEG